MCEARRRSDQMMCDSCGICWDVNDDDPPVCPQDAKPIEYVYLTREELKEVDEFRMLSPLQLSLPLEENDDDTD